MTEEQELTRVKYDIFLFGQKNSRVRIPCLVRPRKTKASFKMKQIKRRKQFLLQNSFEINFGSICMKFIINSTIATFFLRFSTSVERLARLFFHWLIKTFSVGTL